MTQLICMAKHPAEAKNPDSVKCLGELAKKGAVTFTAKSS